MLYLYAANDFSCEVHSVRTPSCGCCVKLKQNYWSTIVLTHGFLSVHCCNSVVQKCIGLAGFLFYEFQHDFEAAKTSKNLEVMSKCAMLSIQTPTVLLISSQWCKKLESQSRFMIQCRKKERARLDHSHASSEKYSDMHSETSKLQKRKNSVVKQFHTKVWGNNSDWVLWAGGWWPWSSLDCVLLVKCDGW